MPDLEQVYLDYKDRDVQFLAISSEGADEVRTFVEENDLTLPIATDGRAVFDAFGVKYLPTTVFIHSDGTVAEKVVGGREYADFEAAIKKLE
jgi:peroxiredoxin